MLQLIRKRASARQFQNKPITKDIIDQVLEAGRLSPSGGNEQAWQFGVINSREAIERLSELAFQPWIKGASLIIALCSQKIPDSRQGRHIQCIRFPHYEEAIKTMDFDLYSALVMEEHQTKIPGTQMALTALEYGIQTTWVSYFDVKAVNEYLRLSDEYNTSELLVMGYSDIKPLIEKKRLEDIVFYNRGDRYD